MNIADPGTTSALLLLPDNPPLGGKVGQKLLLTLRAESGEPAGSPADAGR